MLREKDHVILALDGPSGAGKTSLAQRLQELYDANVISVDSFFLQSFQRTPARLAQVGYFFDIERFKEEIITNLRQKQDFTYHHYDCHADTLSAAINLKFKPLTIIEGVYACHPELTKHYDLKVFMAIEEDQQIARLKKRSADLLAAYLTAWLPKERAYFKKFKIKENSDLIL